MKFLKKNKDIIFNVLLFIVLFIISFVFSFIIAHVWCDQIWSFGFSYNISKGMMIYKDFNVVQMPLYFLIASIFIKIFGNYMISTCVFDSLLLASIGFIMFKNIGWKSIFPFLAFLVFCPSPYNLLCMLLFFIILHLIHNNKYNDYIVALLVGVIFITKQNIGVLLFVPMFFYSKHKIKSFFIFMIPFILLIIYLLFNNSLFEFFDYVFLGLFEFGGNKDIDYILLIIEFMCVGYLIYSFVRSNFKDREALYILIFQLVLYPLCELRHYFPAFIPFLYYFLKNYKRCLAAIIVCSLEVIYVFSAFYFNYIPINIHTNKDLLYLKSPSPLANYLEKINKEFEGNVENIYFDSDYSYLYKMYYNNNPTRLDFIMDGNMGYFSKKEIFKELDSHCKKEKCIFLLYKKVGKDNQFSEYRDFVKKHYKKSGQFDDMDVYSSK